MGAFEMFGSYFKELRIKGGLTLREFCQSHSFDAGNISKIERGLAPPPKSVDVLTKYAEALGLSNNTEEWVSFFDRAAACSATIPADLMSNQNFVAKLPLVFRTLRKQGQQNNEITEEQLRELAELIRRA